MRKSRLKGFSLIELVMTIVVVSIAAIPLSLLLSQHVESTFVSEDYTMGLHLARFEMEKVRNMSYANIVSATLSNYQGYNFNVARTVAYAQGNAASAESLKQVKVDVTKTGSATVLVSLTTYVTKNVLYGL